MSNVPRDANEPASGPEPNGGADPFRAYRAQHGWPRVPPAEASSPHSGRSADRPSPDDVSHAPRPPAPPAAARKSGALRAVGIGSLGLIGGLLAALILQDILGGAFVRDGRQINLALALVIGSLMPVLSIAGVVTALVIDHAARSGLAHKSRRSSGDVQR